MRLKNAINAVSAAALGLVVTATHAQAHHSFAAQYDGQKPITLSGTVAKIEWTNPHIHLYIDVKDEKGVVAHWKFVGRWEGNTLVVDVVGFNTKTWLAGVGTIHSEKLHVTERYTRDSYDTILYDVTMDDPEVFTKPWRIQEIFRLRPNERIREYECIENNEDLLRMEKLLQNESISRKPQ